MPQMLAAIAAASGVVVPTHRHANYGERWGEGAARCFSIECDILDEDHAVRLMPVPDSFVCPISAAIMVDPVATVDGCVYERQYIERWFRARRQQSKHITSPITGLDLPSATLMPLVALQRAIEAYLAHRPELRNDKMAGRSFEEAAQILQCDLFEKQAIHASIQDKVKRLRQANKTLIRMLEEANARILQLEAEVTSCSGGAKASSASAAGSMGSTGGLTADVARSDVAACAEGASAAEPSRSHGRVPPLAGDLTAASPSAVSPASACAAATAVGPVGSTPRKKPGERRRHRASEPVAQLLPLAVALVGLLATLWLLRGAVKPAARPAELPAPPTAVYHQQQLQELHRHQVEGPLLTTPVAAAAAAATAATAVGHMAASGEVNPVFLGQLEQLRYGSLDEKQRAAFMLRHFAAEHAENQVAIRRAGAIGPLVQLLGESSAALREEAARALWSLARNSREVSTDNQRAIGEAGAIIPLVRLLEDEAPRVRVVAAAVLNDLAADHAANQIAITRSGAIRPLIKLLRHDEAPALVMAASLLQSLASETADHQVAAALMGAVQPLVELLRADTLLAQEQAASTLGTLAACSTGLQVAIAQAGAIVPLVERLKGDMMQGTAALALRNLAAGNAYNQAAIVQAGAVTPLVKLLEDGMPAVRAEAARALWNLARGNMENQVAIVRAGAAIPLVALLKGVAQEEATLTLLNLAAAEG